MKRKVIGNVEPKCSYCKNGTLTADKKRVLCKKAGIFNADDSCRKFRYDPLKRVPSASSPALLAFSPEDFKL